MIYAGNREVKEIWAGGRPAVQAWAGGTPVWGGDSPQVLSSIEDLTFAYGRTFDDSDGPLGISASLDGQPFADTVWISSWNQQAGTLTLQGDRSLGWGGTVTYSPEVLQSKWIALWHDGDGDATVTLTAGSGVPACSFQVDAGGGWQDLVEGQRYQGQLIRVRAKDANMSGVNG